MTTTDTGFDFAQWQRDNAARRAALTFRLETYLAGDQHAVTESWESASGTHSVIWYLGKGAFIAPYDTDPRYLAEHLASRHFGFGWDLEIHGQAFRLGRLQETVGERGAW